MSNQLKPGDFVVWRWASGYNHGQIIRMDTGHTQISRNGETCSRDGSNEDPALTIVDHNDTTVLRLSSEVEKAR